jgi:prepilin-type N-terminal cleavage/methylation domain-containing protein
MNYTDRGLSMMEILVVVMLVGIIAVIFGVSGNQPVFERQRGLEAVSNLGLIHNAEKRFFLENNRYFFCGPICTAQEIMRNLTFTIDNNYFNYSIIDTSTPAQPGYRAVATRRSGECADRTLNITHNSSFIVKGCDQW